MESAQVQTTAPEEQVRAAILAALTPFGATAEQNQPGLLELVTGSVGAAYAAGAFRAEEKMPMRITVATAGGAAGTGVSIQVASRGGGGFLSGGIWGMRKARRAEKTWLDRTVAAVQPVTGGMGPQQPQPTPAPTQPMPPTPPTAPSPGPPPGSPPPATPPPAQPPGPPPAQPPQAPSV